MKQILEDSKFKGYVVRLRGLPYAATAADVCKFFETIKIEGGNDGIVFTFTPDGRPTGEAYVEFGDDHDQSDAMKKHKEVMGTRYIEIFTSSKVDMLQAIQQNKYHFGQAALRRRWAALNPGVPLPLGMADASLVRVNYPAGMDELADAFKGAADQCGMQINV